MAKHMPSKEELAQRIDTAHQYMKERADERNLISMRVRDFFQFGGNPSSTIQRLLNEGRIRVVQDAVCSKGIGRVFEVLDPPEKPTARTVTTPMAQKTTTPENHPIQEQLADLLKELAETKAKAEKYDAILRLLSA